LFWKVDCNVDCNVDSLEIRLIRWTFNFEKE
jgi:hypothetical protein